MSTPTLREAAEKALDFFDDHMDLNDHCGLTVNKHDVAAMDAAMESLRAALAAPAEPRVEPAPHPSTPIAALLQQYADECSDFSGPDGYAFALKIANRYAESGPDCQMRCVVHTLLNPPEPAAQREPAIEHCLWARNGHARCPVPAPTGGEREVFDYWQEAHRLSHALCRHLSAIPMPTQPATKPLTDERIKAIYARETGFDLDSSPAALMDFARAIEAAHGITDSSIGDKP